jgi:hypothetical protein
MRRASLVVAWLIALLGARLIAAAPGELARDHTATGMALLSAGMVLLLGGALTALGGRRRARRPLPVARPASTDEWASPSRTPTE